MLSKDQGCDAQGVDAMETTEGSHVRLGRAWAQIPSVLRSDSDVVVDESTIMHDDDKYHSWSDYLHPWHPLRSLDVFTEGIESPDAETRATTQIGGRAIRNRYSSG